MIVAGIDIGSSSSKVVILKDESILSYSVIPTGAESANSAQMAMESALEKAGGMAMDSIGYVIATGYGRIIVPFADEDITELSCHARGAKWLFPSIKTILDMGGQDCKAIKCDEQGRLMNFVMNDKCAAGTGRFLEVLSEVLSLPLSSIGGLSLQATKEVKINSTCAVFAKSEVSALVREGKDKSDILAGLHAAIVNRVFVLLRRVGIEKDFAITGGIAKNIGVVKKLEQKAGVTALIPEEPQIIGALGAALYARDRLFEGIRG